MKHDEQHTNEVATQRIFLQTKHPPPKKKPYLLTPLKPVVRVVASRAHGLAAL